MSQLMGVRPKSLEWCVDTMPCLFTLGYEGQSIDAIIEKLGANGIRLLVDVRKNPISRKPGFSKTALRETLEHCGIAYTHLPGLGVPSSMRRNLGSEASYKILFDCYETTILPANIDSVRQVVRLTFENSRVALMCFEADYHHCHRHKITEVLVRNGFSEARIVHLV